MYAVGRLSSYITRGVSTVSGPFHPFGGAIDIVVVQQQDGSLRSSPWYVRFGKFQGVLKARERVVDINVNGVEADFHMYLNPRGEAYFLKEEVDSDETDAVSLHSGESERKARCLRPNKLKSMDHKFDQCNSLVDSSNSGSFSRTLGFVLDRKTMNDDSLSHEESDSNAGRRSVDSAEIAADLLEMKWSTSLSSKPNYKNQGGRNKEDKEITSGKLEASLVLHEEYFVNKPEDNESNSQVVKKVDDVIVANIDRDGNVEVYERVEGSWENEIPKEERFSIESSSNQPETAKEPVNIVDGSYNEVAAVSVCQAEDDNCMSAENETDEIKSRLKSNGELLDGSKQFTDLDDKHPNVNQVNQERLKGFIRRFPSDSCITKHCEHMEEEIGAHTKSLPNIWSQFDEFDHIYDSHDSKRRFSKWDVRRKDASRIMKEGEKQPSDSEHANTKSKDHRNGSEAGGEASNIQDDSKSWSIWPFSRSRSKKFSQKEQNGKKDCDFDSGSEIDAEKEHLSKSNKIRRELAPTSEQLESLNLTEGKNTVTFKFSTAVLGNQQVDARIFLWKWDTRIVISDVDGTITKSDVLGQFMPLVGRDWSHIGVTHLFSAIKENGYEILFLSARSISQADITRQFLINLKQEGKTLPEGPVVISPDGLFPSLFREVIRRAPHEFKIACLEDIRACFPADWNPFYAGFGNRDTDEFSYLKVGIEKGKIFIINPKGEVVNRCFDTKSYSSLHCIVNGVFPPTCMPKEDF